MGARSATLANWHPSVAIVSLSRDAPSHLAHRLSTNPSKLVGRGSAARISGLTIRDRGSMAGRIGSSLKAQRDTLLWCDLLRFDTCVVEIDDEGGLDGFSPIERQNGNSVWRMGDTRITGDFSAVTS